MRTKRHGTRSTLFLKRKKLSLCRKKVDRVASNVVLNILHTRRKRIDGAKTYLRDDNKRKCTGATLERSWFPFVVRFIFARALEHSTSTTGGVVNDLEINENSAASDRGGNYWRAARVFQC